MPKKAFAKIMEGYQRFASGYPRKRKIKEEMSETYEEQTPSTVVLTCMDSRVVPESIFDTFLGDLFCIRVGGNVLNEDVIASLEFACKDSIAVFILVLGHTNCAVVMGACNTENSNNPLFAKVQPAIDKVRHDKVVPIDPDAWINQVAEEHVKMTMAQIFEFSPALSKLRDEGHVGVVGAIYNVQDGSINILEEYLP